MYINDIFFLIRESGMFYATNNSYQVRGPRGFTEFNLVEETTQMFARIDFPGVTLESVRIIRDPSGKAAIVTGIAPQKIDDASFRTFGTVTGLQCDCCEISNVKGYMGNGVMRLIIYKKMIRIFVFR